VGVLGSTVLLGCISEFSVVTADSWDEDEELKGISRPTYDFLFKFKSPILYFIGSPDYIKFKGDSDIIFSFLLSRGLVLVESLSDELLFLN